MHRVMLRGLHTTGRGSMRLGLSSGARGMSSAPGTGLKTTVMLRRLPLVATQSALQAAVTDKRAVRVELEPGCMMHFQDEASAEWAASHVDGAFGTDSQMRRTSLPAVLVKSLGDGGHGDIRKVVDDPLSVIPLGLETTQVITESAESALAAAAVLRPKAAAVRVHRLSDTGTFMVEAVGIGVQATEEAFGNGSDSGVLSVTQGAAPAAPSVVARLSIKQGPKAMSTQAANSSATFQHIADKFVSDHSAVASVNLSSQAKPSLMVRIHGASARKHDLALNSAVAGTLRGSGASAVNTVMTSKDIPSGLLVAHFASHAEALAAAKALRESSEHGKVSASLTDLCEHAVKLSGVPVGTDFNEVLGTFTELGKDGGVIPSRVEPLPFEDGAVAVVYASEKDAKIALLVAQREARGNSLLVGETAVTPSALALEDACVEMTMTEGSAVTDAAAAELASAFRDLAREMGLTVNIAGVDIDSKRAAVLVFEDKEAAVAAKKAATIAGHAAVRFAQPAFSLEVTNLSPEDSAAQLKTSLMSDTLQPSLISIDRSGLVKYPRSKFVVPGMKNLRGMEFAGEKLRPARLEDFVVSGTSAYDENGADEYFDKFSLERLLRDCLELDPATRFAIARNAFEQAMSDAKALNDVRYLLTENAPDSIRDKASELLNGPPGQAMDIDALFELYLQREDMNRFTHDFKEMRAMLGPENPDDAFDWSEFKIEVPADAERIARQYRMDLAALEEPKEHEGMPRVLQNYVDGTSEYLSTADAERENREVEILLQQRGEELKALPVLQEEKIALGDISTLTDHDRYQWSGAVLDQDSVQHTMAGGRVFAARALVCIGNLRGSGGFGVGKAKSFPDAVQAAFRDALRNLVHVDLYENQGLAHDLYGKHNNCRAYIRATPASRSMVASKLSRAVLERFGIASASVKLVGRRDPYAQVRALFNALRTHENIDEFARDRGQRYVTLKWAYDNKV